jgi:hypothetical protein
MAGASVELEHVRFRYEDMDMASTSPCRRAS